MAAAANYVNLVFTSSDRSEIGPPFPPNVKKLAPGNYSLQCLGFFDAAVNFIVKVVGGAVHIFTEIEDAATHGGVTLVPGKGGRAAKK